MLSSYYSQKLLNLSGILIEDIIHAENSGLPRFVSFAQTMNNYISGILNLFPPYTNSYTEGIDNKIKVLKCNAYGYRNFERFRSRILHMYNTQK